MIRVLIVEDSPVIREFLVHILSSDPDLEIVGIARDGEEALEAVRKFQPDVITMDIYMPRMDGFEATRKIMETQATPIVIVSGSASVKEVAFSFRAFEAGALAVVPRPRGIDDARFETTAEELIRTVKLMSEIKVVRRWSGLRKKAAPVVAQGFDSQAGTAEIRIVVMGASTGGPIALRTILAALPSDFSVPLLVVQHIVSGFAQGFASWLGESSPLPVRMAADMEYALPGQVYIAPDDFQLTVTERNRLRLSKDTSENGLRPSIGCLFRSTAETFGPNAIGILLTGMGSDGARELKLMKDRKAVTIAQDEESSVIFGMPAEAIKMNAATYVLNLSKIAPALVSLTNQSSKRGQKAPW